MLKLDLVAGLTVSLVSLPLAMAFAAAAGLGPDIGLVSAIVAGSVAAIFGGSELNITGPAGSLIGVLAGVLAANQVSGYDDVLALGIVGGVILISGGLIGLGRLVRFVPMPVILGFTGGIGVIILMSQLEDALGLPKLEKSPYFHENVATVVSHFDQAVLAALGVTLLTIIFIEGLGRVIPKAFAPLLGIVGAAMVAWVFDLDVATLASKYGAIPQSLPTPAVPSIDLDRIGRVLGASFTLAALCALESLLSATASDAIAGKRHNSKAELIGCGLANIASPFFGGMPTCGAIARTTLNAQSGAQSRLAGVFNALALLVIMLLLAPVVGRVPTAALAGLLILIAARMMDFRPYLALLHHHHWTDFAMTAVTLLATVFVSLTVGIGLGLAVALATYFMRVRGVPEAELIPEEEVETTAAVAVASIEGALFFHTARSVIEETAEYTPAKVLVVCLTRTEVIDATGIQALKDVVRSHSGARAVYLAGVTDDRRELLDRTGVLCLVGRDRVFETRDDALSAAQSSSPP
ncbi:MAG: SulP family inorganic anion transporter [Myxococcales bacterium]|nr:SulP family inorganic anion transporter [Myxococcales bacterium]